MFLAQSETITWSVPALFGFSSSTGVGAMVRILLLRFSVETIYTGVSVLKPGYSTYICLRTDSPASVSVFFFSDCCSFYTVT